MHRRLSNVRWLAALLVLTAFVVTLPPAAHAATLTVTSDADSGPNTLRAAIAAAGTGDVIEFALPSCPCVITLTSAELTIDKNLTITGLGTTNLAIDGNGTNPVFTITSGTVNISNLTIRHGSGALGGDVSIQGGTVTLDHVVVSGGTASAGGGIYNHSTLVMTNSSLSDSKGNYGAGLYSNGPLLTLTGVTISGNQANLAPGSDSGGLRTDTGTTTLTNVTVSGNTAITGGGGVVDNGSILNLVNVTIANNTASSGAPGGLWVALGTTYITNTIVATNSSAMSGSDCYGTLNSQGYNLIQNTTNCTIAGDTTGNLIGSNPQLGALANNGGPTQTMALGAASPAINAANPAACAVAAGSPTFGAGGVDQRGLPRRTTSTPQFCDMGAFEAQAASNTATSGSGQTTKTNTAFALPLVVSVKDTYANTLGGAVVSFAGPGSGASIVPGTAATNSSGVASFLPTANSVAGTYTAGGTVNGVVASFTLTNTGQLFLPVVLK